MQRYLTPAPVCEALQVSLVTLWSWDKKGITRPLRIGTQRDIEGRTLKRSFAMPEIIIIAKSKEFHVYDQEDQELISGIPGLYILKLRSDNDRNKTVLMHRLILGIVDNPEIEVDHRFIIKLDNRRSKIRTCNHSQNRRNSRKLKESAQSRYKGVYRDNNKWHAQIMLGEQVINLGRFSLKSQLDDI